MTKQFLLLCIVLQGLQLAAQDQGQCGTTFNPQAIHISDPGRYNRFIQLQQVKVQKYME